MPRVITVGAAQLGPIAKSDTRTQVVERMIELMRQAKAHGCDLVVYPELALTTFFPRWYFEDQAEIDAWFEREMPSKETAPLFDGRTAPRRRVPPGLRGAGTEGGRPHAASTQRSSSTRPERSRSSTARCISPAMPSMSPGGSSSISRSATSRSAISAFPSRAPSAASSACASAMTGAGPRPTA